LSWTAENWGQTKVNYGSAIRSAEGQVAVIFKGLPEYGGVLVSAARE
jgi:hypothetical protein